MTNTVVQGDQSAPAVVKTSGEHALTKKLRSISILVPTLVISHGLSAGFLGWMCWHTIPQSTGISWILMLGLVLTGFSVWSARSYQSRAHYLSGRTGFKTLPEQKVSALLHLSVFLLGLMWGIAVAYLGEVLPLDMKALIVPTSICVLLGGVIVFAAVPTLTAVFMTPLVGFSLYALLLQQQTATIVGFYFVLGFVAFTSFALSLVYAKFYSQLVAKVYQAKGQSAVQSELLDELQKGSSDWIWEIDIDGNLIRFPENMLPNSADLGSVKIADYLHRVTTIKGTQFDEIMEALSNKQEFAGIVLCLHWGHGETWIKFSGQPMLDEDGKFMCFRGLASDVTSEKLAEDRIAKLSESDTLTGVLNRGTFSEHLGKAVANLERYGRPFTVLYLDLDNFRLVNDTRGHLTGDRLLTEASERIAAEVREVDSVARLGGDEFAILMENQGDAGAAARLCSRIIGEVGKPYKIDGEEFRIGISIGIALAPLNGTRPDQLLRNADLALYRAKADGRGLFRFFENHMDSELRERRMLEVELRDAASNDELVLHYQPLVDAKTHKTVSMESLIRWQHPIRGLLSPIEFIELAERANLIAEIGAWTLDRACETALNWPSHISVAVNLSAHHFMQADIVSEVRDTLTRTRLSPSRLELEITESLLIHNSNDVIAKLDALKELGVTVAMDDFGTGYSSLSYLMSVPFDKLKIDKSFVDEVCVKDTGKKIVRMVTTLAKELSLKVTAEGVETAEQAEFLTKVGCDTLQGYHFSKPMPEENLAPYFLKETQEVSGNLQTKSAVLSKVREISA